jgi:hypothetical protein
MAAVLLCAASLGSAQTAPPGKYSEYGAGAASCGHWLASRNDHALHGIQINWVLGWVSAAGYYNVQGALRETDADAVSAWVDKYCREHPLSEIKDAAATLVDELAKPK